MNTCSLFSVTRVDSQGSFMEENVKFSSRQLSNSSALSGLSVNSDIDVGYEAAGASSMDEVHDKAIIESLLPEVFIFTVHAINKNDSVITNW